MNHNGFDQVNRLGPACVPDRYSFPCSLCIPSVPFPLFFVHFLIRFVNMQREWSHRVLTLPHIRYLLQQLQLSFPLPLTAFLHCLFPFLIVQVLFYTVSINCHFPTVYFLVYATASIIAVSASIYQHLQYWNPSILLGTYMELTETFWDLFPHVTWKVISFWFVVTTTSPTLTEIALLKTSKSFQLNFSCWSQKISSHYIAAYIPFTVISGRSLYSSTHS
jgi:hypothetical protein